MSFDRAEYNRQWAADNAETLKDYQRAYYQANKERLKNKSKAWRQKNYDHDLEVKRQYLHTEAGKQAKLKSALKKYGITPTQYDSMLVSQGNRCAICPSTEPGGRGRWHIDHDHATGKVRGLLCHYCNTAIGSLNDNPALLRAAAQYLEKE